MFDAIPLIRTWNRWRDGIIPLRRILIFSRRPFGKYVFLFSWMGRTFETIGGGINPVADGKREKRLMDSTDFNERCATIKPLSPLSKPLYRIYLHRAAWVTRHSLLPMSIGLIKDRGWGVPLLGPIFQCNVIVKIKNIINLETELVWLNYLKKKWKLENIRFKSKPWRW